MDDLHLYDRVADELRRDGPQAGLWAKAFAECEGEKSRAEALYLRLRVAQLAASELAAAEAERAQREQLQREAAERLELERQARAKAEGLTPIHLLLIGLIAFFLILIAFRVVLGP